VSESATALQIALATFAETNKFKNKGALCVALVVTDHARAMALPLDPVRLITEGEGQVLGLGKGKVQSILARHSISRVLAEEGGRTSRGSMGNMKAYVAFLNAQQAASGWLDLEAVENFWIAQVRRFFAAKPFMLKLDATSGLRTIVRNLMELAEARQKEAQGTMILGTMMQHLVGAKLDLILGIGVIDHHSSNTNDQGAGRTGDFDVGDVSIHVSTSPTEALIRKCQENINAARRPVIVTTRRGSVLAEGLALNARIADRLDVIEFEQFVATNIYEMGQFAADQRRMKIEELVERYNAIVDAHETDPSLRIEVAQGR